MSPQYVIGLDYGTNSVRTLIVNAANGARWPRRSGTTNTARPA